MKAALKGHQLASRGYASQLGATAEAVERTVEPRRCLASRPCHALFYMMASSRESRLGGYARALDDVRGQSRHGRSARSAVAMGGKACIAIERDKRWTSRPVENLCSVGATAEAVERTVEPRRWLEAMTDWLVVAAVRRVRRHDHRTTRTVAPREAATELPCSVTQYRRYE